MAGRMPHKDRQSEYRGGGAGRVPGLMPGGMLAVQQAAYDVGVRWPNGTPPRAPGGEGRGRDGGGGYPGRPAAPKLVVGGAGKRGPTPPARVGSIFRNPNAVINIIRNKGNDQGGYVVGERLEYYSRSNKCWLPCVMEEVDPETGAVLIDTKEEPLSLKKQERLLRERTVPTKEQIQWMRCVRREGRIEEEAKVFFTRWASPRVGLRQSDFPMLADDIERRLGFPGTMSLLLSEAQSAETTDLSFDDFFGIFWDLFHSLLTDYGDRFIAAEDSDRFFLGSNIEDFYEFNEGERLGEGSFGSVRLAREHESGVLRAIKQVKKRSSSRYEAELLAQEVESLCRVDHPHVCRLYSFCEDKKHLYLVMDYCSGGNLADKYSRAEEPLEESYVGSVMKQVLLGISYVHARGIVHLDLKGENIMLMPSTSTIKPVPVRGRSKSKRFGHPHALIIDLGLAALFRPGDFKLDCNCPGTPLTMAPDAWEGELTPKCDTFSIGCVLFEMLTLGQFPFGIPADCKRREVMCKFWRKKPSLRVDLIADRSTHAQQATEALLEHNRHYRPGATEALRYMFFMKASAGPKASKRREELMDQLALWPKRSILYRSIAIEIARKWPPNQWPTAKSLFTALSDGGNGRLLEDLFIEQFEELGGDPYDAKLIAKALDWKNEGNVEWTDFLAGCIDLCDDEYDGHLHDIFSEVDGDKDGLVTVAEFKALLPPALDEGSVHDLFELVCGRRDHGGLMDVGDFFRHIQKEQGIEQAPRESSFSHGCSGVGGGFRGVKDSLAAARERLYA